MFSVQLTIPLLIGRLLAEPSLPVPTATDRGLLFLKRHDFFDPCAPDPDAGIDDGGVPDASTADAAPPPDAALDGGVSDAGVGDAGVPDAGTCGFQEVDTISMIVQPELGPLHPGGKYAVLYVTPTAPMVTRHATDIFGELVLVTEPMIAHETTYVEDPAMGEQCSDGCGGGQQQESSGCGGGYDESSWDPPNIPDGGTASTEMIGPYEVVKAQPADKPALTAWLDGLGYAYQQADIDAVTPYLALGYHVVAIRVTSTGSLGRRLPPLAITWAGTEIRVPAALGRAQPSNTPLTIYIAAAERYELPFSTVDFAMRTSVEEMGFLTKNVVTLDTSLPPSADPVAFAKGYSEYRATHVVEDIVHVPVAVSCDDGYSLCGDCNAGQHRKQTDFGMIAAALVLAVRRRRRKRGPNRVDGNGDGNGDVDVGV